VLAPLTSIAENVLFFSALEQSFHFDMNAVAKPGVVALPRSEQGSRLFFAFGFHPPFLDARDQHRGVVGTKPWFLDKLASRCRHVGSGGESIAAIILP
jgi:hypothetical protein